MLTSAEGRAARSHLKLSQSRVATETGINRSYISLFEAGKYTLGADEQERLRQFYQERGHVFDDVVSASAAVPARQDSDRTSQAATALAELRKTVGLTGMDSKRTVAALATTRYVLAELDYPELHRVATAGGVTVDGMPSLEEFQQLPTVDKETHENRMANVLLCSSLYGAAWQLGREASTWERIGRALAEAGWLKDNERPTLSIFASKQAAREYSVRCGVWFAPALIRAAEQRRPLSLNIDRVRRRDSWSFFPAA